MLEVNSETDFVAKNEEFTNFVNYLADTILNNEVETVEDVLALKDGEETINDKLISIIAKIGEKISFRRFVKLEKKENEVFGTYNHMGGTIGAVAVLENTSKEVAKDVAMHIAAMAPTAITREEVPAEMIERESSVIKEQVMAEGNPAEIAEKMVVGRLNKFYKEICLEEQAFIKDSNLSVLDYVKQNNGKIVSMVRFAVGEGIDKKKKTLLKKL